MVSPEREAAEFRVADDLQPSLRRGHPWIYRDQLRPVPPSDLPTGSWVRVQCAGFQGAGLYDADSPLAIRLLRTKEAPTQAWVAGKIAAAFERRRLALDFTQTNAFRLLNGEGDGLPGLVVDVYGSHAVVRLDTPSVTRMLGWVVQAVWSNLGLKGICTRANGELQVLMGRPPPDRLIVAEHGIRLHADIATGQKTGLFLDHRENRRWLAGLCGGKSVLNLYAYTGAFSLHACRGGATRIVSVDRAAEAIARARDNFDLNGFDGALHEGITSDVDAYLEDASARAERFDIVIVDPPTFARAKEHRHRALRAYEKLHAQALKTLAPGGLYAAASCTSQVSPEAFRETVANGAARARRALQIVAEFGHAPDHPVLLGHPEGRYLKFVAARCMDGQDH